MVRAMFPGTFDPIHYGHMDIAERAARLFDEILIAVYDKPLKSLLFSPEERIDLVKQSFKDHPKIRVVGYSGLTINMARENNAQVFITNEEHTFISSTTVREIAMLDGDISSMVPPHVEAALKRKVAKMNDSQFPANALRD
jgi:pantetheine-phosphate adenylyltransferase